MSHATTPISHCIFKWVTQLLQLATKSSNESRNYSNEPPHCIAGNRKSELVYLGQWLHVVDGGDGVGDEPGQPEDGGDDDDNRQHQQVQVVATTLLQPIGSTIDIHW